MTKVTIALSTFAKLISGSQEDQIRDLQRYETPGGYDLYRATKSAVHDFVAADENEREVEARLRNITSDLERKKSLEIFQEVKTWRAKNKGVGFSPPRSVWKSPSNVFAVRVEPEIGISRGGARAIISLYCTEKQPLSRASAGAAIELMKMSLQEQLQPGDKLGIYDVHRKIVIKTVSNMAKNLFDSGVATLERELDKLRG